MYAPHAALRLLVALILSTLLHTLLLALPPARVPAAAPPALAARLVPLPAADEPLLAPAPDLPPEVEPQPIATPDAAPPSAPAAAAIEKAGARLAERLLYPPEALARGIQGEARVLVRLDAYERVVDVRLAMTSGHDLLDRAALRAVRSLGRIEGAATTSLVLPVIFKMD